MADYATFANEDFDPNEYANSILAGESYPPQTQQTSKPAQTKAYEPIAKEDISVAISKLNFGIDDVTKQIKALITTHHEQLLLQAASANGLSGSLNSVKAGLCDLEASLENVPYQSMQTQVSCLQRLQQASDILRRTSRFVVLSKRLETQMREMDGGNGRTGVPSQEPIAKIPSQDQLQGLGVDNEDEKERAIAKAALSIAELVALLDVDQKQAENRDEQLQDPSNHLATIPLRSISAVTAHVPFIEEAQAKVTAEMESMILAGLNTLNQSLLASSLQTAYNLRVLPDLVQGLVTGLCERTEEQIRNAFDLNKISKDALAKDSSPSLQSQSATSSQNVNYRSRIRTEPTNLTVPQWTAALWERLEGLMESMATACIKIYTLEKVLKLKKDTVSQSIFLEEAMKVLENKPSATFWTAVGRSLEKHARDAAKGSTFLQQTFGNNYPKLLRLFHEFFAKVAVYTDTVYSQNYQSPETVLVLRALSAFESLYLSRSTTRLNETISQAFSGGARSPPGSNEGANAVRMAANDLDSARFDPLLVRSVARNIVGSFDSMLGRVDTLYVRDRSAVNLQGPTATPQQSVNGQLASYLYQCWSKLQKLEDEHSETTFAILAPTVQNVRRAYDRIVDPLMTAIRRELGAIVAWLHRIDFGGKNADPMSAMGGHASPYMNDLVEKLAFIKAEVLSKFSVGEEGKTWVMEIVRFVMRTFVLHVSIAKPLGESGKLQLTSDMTELEFALSAFLVDNPQSKRGGDLESVGEDYRILRAMRPLLFLDNAKLASPKHTAGLPPLIVLHHILVRSPIPLPHSLHGWQEAEYVRWVDEHSEEEAWTLVEGGLTRWEKVKESEGVKIDAGSEEYGYIRLARTVLRNANS